MVKWIYGKSFRDGEWWKKFFISRKLSWRIYKFGSVCFNRVSNESEFERKLDNIWIGSRKIHVNKLKYGRKVEQGNGKRLEPRK